MNLPTTLRWIALALLGLIIAAAVALGASRLASQQIGIASESVSAGDNLAPPITPATRGRREKPQKEDTTPEAQQPTETVEPVEPEAEAEPPLEAPAETSSGDDEEGGGGGGGDGGGPDD